MNTTDQTSNDTPETHRQAMARWLRESEIPVLVLGDLRIFHQYKDYEAVSYWFRFDPDPTPEDDLTGAFDIRKLPGFEDFVRSNPEPRLGGLDPEAWSRYQIERTLWLMDVFLMAETHLRSGNVEVL